MMFFSKHLTARTRTLVSQEEMGNRGQERKEKTITNYQLPIIN